MLMNAHRSIEEVQVKYLNSEQSRSNRINRRENLDTMKHFKDPNHIKNINSTMRDRFDHMLASMVTKMNKDNRDELSIQHWNQEIGSQFKDQNLSRFFFRRPGKKYVSNEGGDFNPPQISGFKDRSLLESGQTTRRSVRTSEQAARVLRGSVTGNVSGSRSRMHQKGSLAFDSARHSLLGARNHQPVGTTQQQFEKHHSSTQRQSYQNRQSSKKSMILTMAR